MVITLFPWLGSLVLVAAMLFPFPVAAEETVEMSVEEQNKKALEAFRKVLDLTGEADRMEVLPEIESSFLDIIAKYPKANLTEEIYWRLLQIYLNDHRPPSYDKAEALFQDFLKKRPGSPATAVLSDTLLNSYYRQKAWERLIRFLTPTIKKFIETKVLSRSLDMYYYAEAKYNLGDLGEAEKGYRIVAEYYPHSKDGVMAKDRLVEIERKRLQEQK